MDARTLSTFRLAAVGLLVSFTALAGPPAICHPIDIGTAKSLPWRASADFNAADPSYDLSRLNHDTLALLSPGTPIKVRMETMRRAALYTAKDSRLAYEIAARLMARALDAESTGKPDAMAWFDAGYFVETLKQASLVYKWDMLTPAQKQAWTLRGESDAIDGVQWVERAIRIGGENKDVRYALSLIDADRGRKQPVRASK